MNLDKYEKIDGREALKRLIDGEDVFMKIFNELLKFKLLEDGLRADVSGCKNQIVHWTFNQVYTSENLYIPKPFDVRQALFDHPNEWMAAYNDERGKWIQVGFDTVSMRPIKAYYGYSGLVKGATAQQATSFELDACIPIEDVPEEATR